MRYRVSVNIVVSPYVEALGEPTDQVSGYTQFMIHNEYANVDASTYADAGEQCDRITAGIRKVLHGDGY